jgi:hypothetical protein
VTTLTKKTQTTKTRPCIYLMSNAGESSAAAGATATAAEGDEPSAADVADAVNTAEAEAEQGGDDGSSSTTKNNEKGNTNGNNGNGNDGDDVNDDGDPLDMEDDSMPIPHPAPVVLVHANPLNENDDGNEDMLVDDGPLQVVLPLETFAEDLHMRLGRANGNIYHRTPGKPGVHDGQVMVRLKKKRFIVLDYSIQPNRADLQAASMNPHIRCPKGAGRTRCSVSGCKKVGIPVLLYDSEPDETVIVFTKWSLFYMSTQPQRKTKDATQEGR